MDYMFESGFLGTKAPLFMDFVVIIVTLLPLLVLGAIAFARRGLFKTHALLQTVIFMASVIVVGYFEYGVRIGGGFKLFAAQSSVDHTFLSTVLAVHIIIATVTFILWCYVVYMAIKEYRKNRLPGAGASSRHKVWGKRLYVGIVLTSLTGLLVYVLLFIF